MIVGPCFLVAERGEILKEGEMLKSQAKESSPTDIGPSPRLKQGKGDILPPVRREGGKFMRGCPEPREGQGGEGRLQPVKLCRG